MLFLFLTTPFVAGIQTKFNSKYATGHTLYMKEHNVRNSHASKPIGKTLFILNVPPYYTKVILATKIYLFNYSTVLLISKIFQKIKQKNKKFEKYLGSDSNSVQQSW